MVTFQQFFCWKGIFRIFFCCFLSKWIYSGSTRAPSPTCVAPVVCIFPVLATQRHAEFFFISVFQMSLQNTVKYPVPIFIKIVRIGLGYGFKILLTLILILFSHKNLFPGNKSLKKKPFKTLRTANLSSSLNINI